MSLTAKQIGTFSREALEREARLSPKPGLVDAEHCGAHNDMNLSLLLKSAAALEPYFVRFAARGMHDASLSPEGRLFAIRADGREAEAVMFRATSGVNTHKGALFLLGVLCYATGQLIGTNTALEPKEICRRAARVCSGITSELGETAGRAYARYGARGARGEAEDGYPNALAALEACSQAISRGANEADGWRIALLTLISRVKDANVLARCGETIAFTLQERAAAIAAQFPANAETLLHDMHALDTQCCLWHASPGGSADLLACAMFLQVISRFKAV